MRRITFGIAILATLAACPPPPPALNPASLWLNYSGREIDLVLVDHEPPPF